MCLAAICTSLEKRLFEYSANILIGLFVFVRLSCKGSLYCLDIIDQDKHLDKRS